MWNQTWHKKTPGISNDPKIIIVQIWTYSDNQIRNLRKFLNSEKWLEISEEERNAIFKEIAIRELAFYSKNQAYIKKKIWNIF